MLPEVIQAVDKKAGRYPPVSIPDYEDLRLRTSSLQGLAGYWRAPRHIDIDGEPVEVGSEFVTDNYFDVLEVRPLIGRSFEPGDNTGPGGRPVVMLSERLWSNRFAGDPALVGRQVRLDTEPFDVIGIVPATYGRDHNVFWQTPPEIWLPSATYARFMAPGEFDVIARRRGAGILQLFGRLTPAATIRQTQAELETIITTLPRATGSLAGANIEVVPAGRAKFYPGYRQSFSRRLALVGLIGALVLVLACSNLANLLLERTTRRRRELALRASIGAGRSRLIRQLLTESLVIGVPGFAASLLVAHLLLRLVSAYPLALGVPVDLDLHLTGRIVLLCLLTCLAVVIAFSLVPVLRTTRGNLAESASLRDGDVGGRSRLTHALVATQVALCAVLLVGTFLITRAVASAQSMDLGFQTDRLIGLTQRRSPGIRGDKELVPMGVLDPERWNVPGIEAAAMASPSPLHGWTSDGLVNDASTAAPPGNGDSAGGWRIADEHRVKRRPSVCARGRRRCHRRSRDCGAPRAAPRHTHARGGFVRRRRVTGNLVAIRHPRVRRRGLDHRDDLPRRRRCSRGTGGASGSGHRIEERMIRLEARGLKASGQTTQGPPGTSLWPLASGLCSLACP